MAFAIAALRIFVAVRFGILALAFSFLASHLLVEYPLTLDFSRWYAGRSLLILFVLAALAFYGFSAALAGRPLFGAAALDD